MKALFNSSAFYFLVPMYFALGLVLTFFDVPGYFYPSFLALPATVTVIFLVSGLIYPFNLRLDESIAAVLRGRQYRGAVIFLIAAIIITGPLDVYVNGFKLLNPSTYAEFNGWGRYIRHISSLCWILVPAAFIFFSGKMARTALVLYAIVFPIVIIDRNRLFMAFFSFFMFLVLGAGIQRDAVPGNRRSGRLQIFLLLLVVLGIFSVVGYFRSGDSFIVDTSGSKFIPGFFPLHGFFLKLPALLQQIVLYIAVPVFNFGTVVFYGFRNEQFLLSQLSPFGREAFDAYPYSPIMVERFNVGTEFYPWLLYGGMPMVIPSIIIMMLAFLLAVMLFRSYPNIFTLLIFMRVAYIVLMMGFAPQFYILLNLMFIVLMLAMWLGCFMAENLLGASKSTEKEA
jgi:hypothetical protein